MNFALIFILLNIKGFGSKNWQSRVNHKAYRLPEKVDCTQGELVQEEIIWDAPQSSMTPMNANAAHTMVSFFKYFGNLANFR